MRVAKEDTVKIIAGNDKGKTGKVLKVYPKGERIIVEGVNFIKRHTKARSRMEPGGIIEKEAPIHVSNVLVICPRCGEGVRPKRTTLAEGKRARVCNKCNEIIGKV